MDKFTATSGSLAHCQRRLFASCSLVAVLEERNRAALREFKRKQNLPSGMMIEALIARVRLEPLSIATEVKLRTVRMLSTGDKEREFAVEFTGDPSLFDFSPDPLQDEIPEEFSSEEWHLKLGETLHRPFGEVFRSELILMAESEHPTVEIDLVRGLVERQTKALRAAEVTLRADLQGPPSKLLH